MNRLIIVGNGFDLMYGLPTRYEDFILWYLKESFKVAEKEGKYSDELIGITYPTYYNHHNPNWIDEFENGKDLLRETKANNFSFHLIGKFSNLLLLNTNGKKWINIECDFYSCLSAILNSDNKVNDVIPSNFRRNEKVSLLNSQMRYITSRLSEYLTESTKDFDILSKTSVNEQLQVIFSNSLLSENESDVLINAGRSNRIDQIRVLNFNYTDTISRFLKTISNPRNSIREIQIHGNIQDLNSIVFGFGDELDKHYQIIEDLNDNLFFEHIKSFKYFQNSKYQDLMTFVRRSEKLEVYVLGHSLGLSDRTMLSQIFEYEKLEKVKLFYYQKSDGINDFTEKTYEISRHFKDKGRMRLKVVPFSMSEPMPQLV